MAKRISIPKAKRYKHLIISGPYGAKINSYGNNYLYLSAFNGDISTMFFRVGVYHGRYVKDKHHNFLVWQTYQEYKLGHF
jgi:hypothetical protein